MNNYSKSYRLALGIAIVLILATVLVTGCRKASVSSGVISEISISTAVDSNNRPVNPTTVFSTDAEGFYCSFKVSGFPIGSKLQAQWIYVGGDPEAEMKIGKNYAAEMQTATITTEGQGYTSTVYSAAGMPDYTWPKGDYKVVISVDGQEKGSTTFKVQ